MNNNTYKHTDYSGDFISMHDCTVSRLEYTDGVLALEFDEGFWLKPVHHANRTEKSIRTGKAAALYTASAPVISLFKKGLFGKTAKKELTPAQLCELISEKGSKLEIIGRYPADRGILIKCWVKDKKVSECHITLTPASTAYHW